MAKKKTAKKFSLKDCVALAQRYLEADKEVKTATAAKKEAQVGIVETMKREGVSSHTAGGLKITLVTPSSMVYDAEGIYSDLTARQRPLAFDRVISLSDLSPERRTEINKQIHAMLSPGERKVAVKNILNVDRLSEAVQAGRIEATVVADHATEKESASYIRVTVAGEG